MDINLKPCPFCGGQVEIEMHEDASRRCKYGIECKNYNCEIQPFTAWYAVKEDCIDAWNRRVDDGR